MFTGIIEQAGTVKKIQKRKNLNTFEVFAGRIAKGIKKGASVAVNGVCLTVKERRGDTLHFDVMKETLDVTTLGKLKIGQKVNLEQALKVNGNLDGHFVTGHVDAVSVVRRVIRRDNYLELHIGLVKDIHRYIVPKGSICLNGVSLTVGKVAADYFSVYLIPFTKDVTTLGQLRKGSEINVETDILAKYILHRSL